MIMSDNYLKTQSFNIHILHSSVTKTESKACLETRVQQSRALVTFAEGPVPVQFLLVFIKKQKAAGWW